MLVSKLIEELMRKQNKMGDVEVQVFADPAGYIFTIERVDWDKFDPNGPEIIGLVTGGEPQ